MVCARGLGARLDPRVLRNGRSGFWCVSVGTGTKSYDLEDILMKNCSLRYAFAILSVGLLGGVPHLLAQDLAPNVHLSGLINDYTPVTGVSGPWGIRGEWSLNLRGDSGNATFSA